MTLNQLTVLTSTWLDDLANTYFTVPQIWTWLNNAQRETQKQLVQAGENFFVRRVSTQCVQNQDTYALPTDFMRLNKLERLDSGTGAQEVRSQLGFVTLTQLDSVSMTTGKPEAYNIFNNCLVMRPIPDNTYTMYMDYTPQVTDMTVGTQTPNIPERYHEYLAILATIDGLLRDRRDPSWMEKKKDFYLQMMKDDSENRNVDTPRMVVMTDVESTGWNW